MKMCLKRPERETLTFSFWNEIVIAINFTFWNTSDTRTIVYLK